LIDENENTIGKKSEKSLTARKKKRIIE